MALRRVLKEPQRSEALSRSNFKYREELPRRPSALAAAVVNAALGRGAPAAAADSRASACVRRWPPH